MTTTRRLVMAGCCAALALGLGACLAPPVVLEAGEPAIDFRRNLYPAGTELVELEVAPGEHLRGVFVPSDPCAPVVLYLLEARGSVAGEEIVVDLGGGARISFRQPRTVPRQLASLGFATLIVDYRGVGPSDGDRSATHLADDVRAMWDCAVQRAGGDSQRVFLRGTSLGSLAAAWLLEHGARPGGVALIAPIRDDTVVRHFAESVYGDVAAALAAPLFAPVMDVDIAHALGTAPMPLAVWSSPEDELLPPAERVALRTAVRAAGHDWDDHAAGPCGFEAEPLQHVRIAMDSRDLMPGERDFWERVQPDPLPIADRVLRALATLSADDARAFPPDGPERGRLGTLLAEMSWAPPALAAALALTDNSAADNLVLLPRLSLDEGVTALDMRTAAAVFALSDPAGPLPTSQIGRYARQFVRGGKTHDVDALEVVLELARGMAVENASRLVTVRNERGGSETAAFRLHDTAWRPLYAERGLSPHDAARQALRVLLKNALLPDRVVIEGDGTPRLEVRIDGAWRPVDAEVVLQPRPSPAGASDASSGGASGAGPAAAPAPPASPAAPAALASPASPAAPAALASPAE